MRLTQLFFGTLLIAVFVAGCGDCEKLYLNQDEKAWASHFRPGQRSYYKSDKDQIDTLEVKDTSNNLTVCNKLEVSEFQFETYNVHFRFASANQYGGKDCWLRMTRTRDSTTYPAIEMAGFGTLINGVNLPHLKTIDTTIGGIRYESVVHFQDKLNAESYGGLQMIKDFYWDKRLGLVAYTTGKDEFFVRVKDEK